MLLGAANVADEAKALARDGADQALVPAAVADCPARRVDPAGQGGFRDDPPVPDLFNQIVLGDDAVAILDEIDEEVEHLRLDGNAFAAARKLAAVDVKYMIGKEKLHGSIHGTPERLKQ